MFTKLEDRIDNFYELSENDQEVLKAEISAIAESDPKSFYVFMDEMGYGLEYSRPIFYEALSSNTPNNWASFFTNELTKLIQAAEHNQEEAIEELDSIQWMTDIAEMENEYYDKLRKLFFSKLKSPNPEVREQCCTAFFNVLAHMKETANASEIKLLQSLLQDPNIKTKVYAFVDLKEAHLLPAGFQFSFADKIKIKLNGLSDFIK